MHVQSNLQTVHACVWVFSCNEKTNKLNPWDKNIISSCCAALLPAWLTTLHRSVKGCSLTQTLAFLSCPLDPLNLNFILAKRTILHGAKSRKIFCTLHMRSILKSQVHACLRSERDIHEAIKQRQQPHWQWLQEDDTESDTVNLDRALSFLSVGGVVQWLALLHHSNRVWIHHAGCMEFACFSVPVDSHQLLWFSTTLQRRVC